MAYDGEASMICPLGMKSPTKALCARVCLKKCKKQETFRADDLTKKKVHRRKGTGHRSKKGESPFSSHFNTGRNRNTNTRKVTDIESSPEPSKRTGQYGHAQDEEARRKISERKKKGNRYNHLEPDNTPLDPMHDSMLNCLCSGSLSRAEIEHFAKHADEGKYLLLKRHGIKV